MAQTVNEAPGWAAAGYVLAFQSCLGFAFYGATANLVLLLQTYAGEAENRAETLTNYFGAVVGLTPLIGGFLSDRVMGCFNTIVLGATIFMAALSGVIAAVHWQAPFVLMPALFVVLPLGYGLLTANINVFGAQQFSEGKDKTSWFSWFYFSINVGSILAFLIPGMIQQNISFALGLAVPCGVLFLGTCLLISAKSKFVHHCPPEANVGAEASSVVADDKQVWFKIMPAMSLTIVFSICYCQMQTTWYVQGMWMNRLVHGFDVPVAYMMCADPLFVMLAIYFLEGYIFPKLRSLNCMPSPVSRMALGMMLSCCGMYAAHFVEKLRLTGVAAGSLKHPSSLSIMFQVPQFAFVAFAEVFVYTTIQDYAFSLAPDSMKSTVNAVNLFCGSVANVIAGYMTTAFTSWIPPSNPNYGHYDCFYLLLCGICFLGALGFVALRERPAALGEKAAVLAAYGAI